PATPAPAGRDGAADHRSKGKAARGDEALEDFFFSSRRRHTRWPRDWSSDVCSSDLLSRSRRLLYRKQSLCGKACGAVRLRQRIRSEERRVGKECRSRRAAYRYKKRSEGSVPGRY